MRAAPDVPFSREGNRVNKVAIRMNGSLLGLLLPEALVRIQFVTTTKPLIIESLGTPAGKYGALAAALFLYDASNASSAFSQNPKDDRGTLSLIALFELAGINPFLLSVIEPSHLKVSRYLKACLDSKS